MSAQFEYGTYRLLEVSPCIDAGDPANPYDPDNTRPDQGALYYIAPVCEIELTAYGTPIFIPSGGGSFDFDIELTSIVDSTITVDVWLEIDTPTGGTITPLILRTGIMLTPYASILRSLSQNVPGTAPSGYYVYRAGVGIYPSTVIDEDSFNFGKLASDGGASQGGNWNVSGWEEASVQFEVPTECCLSPAYPNPFNPETTLSFSLPQAGKVSLVVYDLSGSVVATLYDGHYEAGYHQAVFSGAHLPSGVYFARLTAGDVSQTQKMMLVK